MSAGRISKNSPSGGARTVKLLRVAADLVGGDKALARRLNIRETLLASLLSGRYELPVQLLYQAVDIILEERESRQPLRFAGRPAAQESDG